MFKPKIYVGYIFKRNMSLRGYVDVIEIIEDKGNKFLVNVLSQNGTYYDNNSFQKNISYKLFKEQFIYDAKLNLQKKFDILINDSIR